MVRSRDTAQGVLGGYRLIELDRPAHGRRSILAFARAAGLRGAAVRACEGLDRLAGPVPALEGWLAGRLGYLSPVVNRQPVARAPIAPPGLDPEAQS